MKPVNAKIPAKKSLESLYLEIDTLEVSGSSSPFQVTMHMLVGDASDG
jgi:hypothetical protein